VSYNEGGGININQQRKDSFDLAEEAQTRQQQMTKTTTYQPSKLYTQQ